MTSNGTPCDAVPLRIDSIEVRNYRRFAHLAVDFHPELTVVVAKNGCGKTAVLDAIAVALGPFIGAFDNATGVHFRASDVRRVRNPKAVPVEMEQQYPLTMTAEGVINGRPDTWRRELAGAKSRTTYGESRGLTDYGKSLQGMVRDTAAGEGSGPPVLPLVSYYGTGRLWGDRRLTTGKTTENATSRMAGYLDCLDSASHYKVFADWFERLCRMEYEERNVPERLTEVLGLLSAIRTAVDAALSISGWHGITFKSSQLGIVAEHDTDGQLPVEWLSDGIRNMIALVADIAHRAVRLNAHLGSEAARLTPGIVMIDEVDMHLHPEWQQTVVQSLRSAFPRVQLIVTTHSPQVLTTVRKEHVRLLGEDGVVRTLSDDLGTFGSESSRLLQEVFGVHSRPPGVEAVAKLHEYMRLIESNEHETTRAKHLRRDLEDSMGSGDPDLLLADIRISQLKVLRRT
jgi:predicted ATP-binding protein involved in virulence